MKCMSISCVCACGVDTVCLMNVMNALCACGVDTVCLMNVMNALCA